MRDIKFRGKRRDNGEWVIGQLIANDYILAYIDLAESWGPQTDDHKLTCRAYMVNPETVGQYTGQVYNKAELFEGDIVEIEYHEWALNRVVLNPFNEDKTQKVIRLLCRFGVDSSFHLNRIDDGSNASYAVQFSGSAVMRKDIIGNATDHPHLLNPSQRSDILNTMITDPNAPKAEGQEEVKAPATETQQEQVPQGEVTEE